MKKAIVVVILTVVSIVTAPSANAAANWDYTGETDTYAQYLDSNYTNCRVCYDRDTVYLQWNKDVPLSGKVSTYRAQLRQFFGNAAWVSRVSYRIAQYAFDCDSYEFAATGASTFYDSSGRVLKTFSTSSYALWDWGTPTPDSMGEALVEAACA